MAADITPVQQEATDKICHQEICMIEARARECALGAGKAGVCSKHGAKVDIEIMTCSYEGCKEIAFMNNICKLHNNERIKKRRKCSILGGSTPPDRIMVEGCGMADVNGIYQRDGKLAIPYKNNCTIRNKCQYTGGDEQYDSVYKYTKKAIYSGESTTAIHNGEEVVFTLYRREFGWQISILDSFHGLDCGRNSTVTFYAHELLVHVPEKYIKVYKDDDDDDDDDIYDRMVFERGYTKSVYDNDKYPLPAESRVPPKDSWEVKGSGIGPPPRVYITSTDLPSINDYKEQITGASYKLYYLSKYGTNTRQLSNKVITTALKACGIPPSIFQSNESSHVSLVDQLHKLVRKTIKPLKPDIQWRESEVLMKIKSNNIQLYNCVVRHESIYPSNERQIVGRFGSQYPEGHEWKDDRCGNHHFIGVEPTSEECIFTNKLYPSLRITRRQIWSVVIDYQGKPRRFGQYNYMNEALKARDAALEVLTSSKHSKLNQQQIEENVNLARDTVLVALQQYSDERYIIRYKKYYKKKPSLQQLEDRYISIRYRGYGDTGDYTCPCNCQVAASPVIIQTIKTNKSKTWNECSEYKEPISNNVKKSGDKTKNYTGRRHHYESVVGCIHKSEQIFGSNHHLGKIQDSLMAAAVRYIEKDDPEEGGSLHKEVEEVLKMKKSGSIRHNPKKRSKYQ